MSSQTSLAGGRVWRSQTEGAPNPSSPYVDAGPSWSAPRLANPPSKKSHKPKLPKIKSSPSNGALAAARASHAKSHRRGNSIASATQSPTSPTFVPDFLLQTASPLVPASAHADPYSVPESKSGIKSKAKIKPLLRKFSSQEKVLTQVDLSRSAAENEGLGIYTSSEIGGSQPVAEARRGYHHRTTSGNSQISSTTTSSNRYGAQYMHPLRQTPRPYTPPIASSYKTSLESDAPTVNTSGDIPYIDPHSRQASSNTTATPTSYAPLPSSRRPPPLHVRTGSASRLTSSSQTNLPGTPSSLRFNSDITTPPDMISPTARSSFDTKLSKRSRSNTINTMDDPVSQQAAVQALRQKFREEVAAKERKYQEQEARAQEKEARRQERREENERRISEKRERKRARSNAASEKSSFVTPGDQYEGYPAVAMRSQELLTEAQPQQRARENTVGSAGKSAHSKWSLFWFQFRTMWLRLKRKVSRSST